METSIHLPVMHDKVELLKRADAFAQNLISGLNQFNEQNPRPTMDKEAWQRLKEKHGDKIPGANTTGYEGYFHEPLLPIYAVPVRDHTRGRNFFQSSVNDSASRRLGKASSRSRSASNTPVGP